MGFLRRLLIAPVVAAALAVAAPALAQSDAPVPMRMVTSFEVSTLDPATAGFWMAEFGVAELLIQFRADGRHHPWLLESWESVDDLTWVLTLREGVTFQNGKPVDAEAVVAVIDRQLEVSTGARAVVPEDVRFAVTGPLEITVTSDQPFPGLLGVLASESTFMIYNTELVEAAAQSSDWESLAGAGFYTGPYVLETLTPEGMTMSRNETYWQGTPALPGLSVQFVPDGNARILAVQNGEADIALYPPAASKPVVDANPSLHFNYDTPGSGGFMFFTNFAEPPFDDPLMRRAFNNAMDYDELANQIMGGMADPAVGLYQPIVPWALALQGTDRETAETLMDEAGWSMGEGGMRARGGQPLAITLLTYPQQPDSDLIARAIQAQLRPYGVEINIGLVDDITAYTNENDSGWHAAIISGNQVGFGGMPEAFIVNYLRSDGTRNPGPLQNAELDALSDELGITVDPARRTEILHRIQEIAIAEEAYAFPLIFSRPRVVVNDAYRNYQPGFNLFHVSWETAPTAD